MSKAKTTYFVDRQGHRQEYELITNEFGETIAIPMKDGPVAKLRGALHGLLGAFDGRDPNTDKRISLETTGARIRQAQAVLEEVE